MTHTNTEAVSELLPCPFCGGEPLVSTYETESLWSHDQVTYTKVECSECEIALHSEPGYELEAPAAWNRRAANSAGGVEVKARSNDQFQVVGDAFLGAIGRPSPAAEAEPVAWREAYERLMNWLLRYPKFTLGDLGQLERDLGPFAREPGNSPTVAIPHPSSPVSAEVTERNGIYVASKVAHAEMWKDFRNFEQLPIISTWIDEAGVGESASLEDLWRRCVHEASHAAALIIYRRPDEVLKGAWVELGAALASGVPVFAVGIEEFTVANHAGITHCENLIEARRAALAALNGGRENG